MPRLKRVGSDQTSSGTGKRARVDATNHSSLLADHVEAIQQVLRRRLTGVEDAAQDPWLTTEGRHAAGIQQLSKLLVDIATKGQGESMLVLGQQGAGKSAMVAGALRVAEANKEVEGLGGLAVVHLHGSVHGDDAAAYRETVRQLLQLGMGSQQQAEMLDTPARDQTIGMS